MIRFHVAAFRAEGGGELTIEEEWTGPDGSRYVEECQAITVDVIELMAFLYRHWPQEMIDRVLLFGNESGRPMGILQGENEWQQTSLPPSALKSVTSSTATESTDPAT